MIGAGGHAKVVIGAAKASGREVIAVLDDREEVWGKALLGVEVKGGLSLLNDLDGEAVIAIGRNDARKRIDEEHKPNWGTVIHPHSWIDPSASIGEGSVVFAGALIQPDVRIGRHAIINTSATVDHDCDIRDYGQIAPGANLGGNVLVGTGGMVGIGASVHQGSSIGEWATLGGGAFLKGDLPAGMVAVGVPAKGIRKNG